MSRRILRGDAPGNAPDQAVAAVIAAPAASRVALDPRTLRLLEAPIAPMLLRLAWPNIAVMLVMASTGLIETWWVSRLGLDALAGVALVFPLFMMMQMLSAGAMGGGISSAVARALGGGRRDDADALVLHAIIINVAIGGAFAALVLGFGPSLYRALGGEGGSLAAALVYSNIVFAGTPLVWLMNALASVIRGTGNMLVPALAVSVGVVLLVPLSPCLIFGLGPFPALGIAGAGIAVISTTALTAAVLALYLASGRSVVRFAWVRPRARLFSEILRVGAVASVSTLQTTLTVVLATGLVGASGGPAAVAGYGTGNRLEYLLVPLVFGLGAPLVALVGTNLGAGRRERALRIAFTGAAVAFVHDRDGRAGGGDIARRLARLVQRRRGDARGRRAVPAHRRTGLRVFRHGSGAVFRLARRRPAAVAAIGRAAPSRDRDRRRLDRPVIDRVAGVAVRRSRLRPRGVRADDRRRGRPRCLVHAAARRAMTKLPPGTKDFAPMSTASTDRMTERQPGSFWVPVLCGAVILTIGIGARQSFGIFQKPIAAELGVGRELWSFANRAVDAADGACSRRLSAISPTVSAPRAPSPPAACCMSPAFS